VRITFRAIVSPRSRRNAMILLSLLLIVTALTIMGFVLWKRKALGLPKGQLISADSEKWSRCERELFSPHYRLVGRPDYLFQEKGGFIPVEVKSSLSPRSPYRSHVLQLVAYCLLVEEVTGFAPPYGVIAYKDRRFSVNYTPTLKAELLRILEEMRETLVSGSEPGVRESQKCLNCGYRRICFG
jgi:CRISPR-associated exonuclease Cas4